MPSCEYGKDICNLTAVHPRFPQPGILFRNGDEVDELFGRHKIVHEMSAGSHPDLVRQFETLFRQPISRHQAAIGHAAGEARLLRAQQSVAYNRVDAVGAYQCVKRDRFAAFKMRLYTITVFYQAREPMCEMYAVGRNRIRQRAMQIGTVQGIIRCAKSGLDHLTQGRAEQNSAVIPTSLVECGRLDAGFSEPFSKPEPMQDARSVSRLLKKSLAERN